MTGQGQYGRGLKGCCHQIIKKTGKTIWLMKKERINGLSCESARNVCIVATMAKLGHFPTRTTEKEAWFLSPFRPETQASFKVSKKLNRWYDHGEGVGGNGIDLVCRIRKCSVKKALQLIEHGQPSFSFHRQPIFSKEVANEHNIVITEIRPLTHVALKEYLKSRNVAITTARKLVKEVHYEFKGKSYFAIGLKNDSRGWELRNKYVKNSSSPKDSTHIKNGNTKLIITEGMFDLLSLLEHNGKLERVRDFLVLNSTAFLQKAMKTMEGYTSIELYLDNDANGKRTAKSLMDHAKNCIDKSALYTDFKDINEWLMDD